MAASPFLALPAEIRLRIYSFLLPRIPLSTSPTTYAGLLYSCRFIRQELEPEILKLMTDFLLDIRNRCRREYPQDMEFDIPQTLEELYNLQVSRPIEHKLFTRDDPIMALMYMHLNIFTISSQIPTSGLAKEEVQRRTQRNMVNLAHWIGSRDKYAQEPVAKRTVYDFATARQVAVRSRLYDCQRFLWRRDAWAVVFRRSWDADMLEGAEFMRYGTEVREKATGVVFRVQNLGWCVMRDGVMTHFSHFD